MLITEQFAMFSVLIKCDFIVDNTKGTTYPRLLCLYMLISPLTSIFRTISWWKLAASEMEILIWCDKH